MRFGDASWGGHGEAPQVGRFLKALWTISAQRIAVVDQTHPDRASLRRASRHKLVRDGAIRVVTLRRMEGSAEYSQAATVEWRGRWVVSGHWRNQYLPSARLHRQQWISAYVKGPEGKPLILKNNVTNVAR
jgi:hypothetical protein